MVEVYLIYSGIEEGVHIVAHVFNPDTGEEKIVDFGRVEEFVEKYNIDVNSKN